MHSLGADTPREAVSHDGARDHRRRLAVRDADLRQHARERQVDLVLHGAVERRERAGARLHSARARAPAAGRPRVPVSRSSAPDCWCGRSSPPRARGASARRGWTPARAPRAPAARWHATIRARLPQPDDGTRYAVTVRLTCLQRTISRHGDGNERARDHPLARGDRGRFGADRIRRRAGVDPGALRHSGRRARNDRRRQGRGRVVGAHRRGRAARREPQGRLRRAGARTEPGGSEDPQRTYG